MKDFGRSDDPAVQMQLDRLSQLSLPDGRVGLDTIRALLARLGNPQDHLPPVFHVAGTNGKGSTCAFLRAVLEADGKTVHATTSPHLVRYNERIRVAGELIADANLAALLKEVLDAGEELGPAFEGPSFFEVTIAASFLAFSRTPADACVIEVGLGGRFDATNVIEKPAICGIAALGIDHERFLLAPDDGVPQEPLARIAFEKAGIAKQGVPLVTMEYPRKSAEAIATVAEQIGAPIHPSGLQSAWTIVPNETGMTYTDKFGQLALPNPALNGQHQMNNAGLAVAMLRHQSTVAVSEDAISAGLQNTCWAGRLQLLTSGPLIDGSRKVWLDGGHNPDAGEAIARHFTGQRIHLILGMIVGKNPDAITDPLEESIASLTVVPISTHDHQEAAFFGEGAKAANSVPEALASLPQDGLPVLIAGSLYLAGDVLRLNNELPD